MEQKLLEEIRDEHGVMRVVELGAYRFLEFGEGEGVEQSCVYSPDPGWLEYDYTRAMLLGALAHPQPRRALFLGLGAGSLVQACLKHLPLEAVEVIELRAELPGMARRHLGLTDDPRLEIRIGDARQLLGSAALADLVFVDLYTDEGLSPAHLTADFLVQCRHRLLPGGWLVINQWGAPGGVPVGAPLLRRLFERHYWELPLNEGNVVLLVPASTVQTLPDVVLRERAEAQTVPLGYSLVPLLERLRPCS